LHEINNLIDSQDAAMNCIITEPRLRNDEASEDFPIRPSLLNLFLTINQLYIKINQTKTKSDE